MLRRFGQPEAAPTRQRRADIQLRGKQCTPAIVRVAISSAAMQRAQHIAAHKQKKRRALPQ
jgi:hypothetical protein